MKGCLIACGIVLLALLLVGGCGVSSYNGIVTREQRVTAAWSKIQSQYQRRFDLVPQLVETVKGAAGFEQSTITAVTEARASVSRLSLPATLPDDPAKLRAYVEAQQTLAGTLTRLIANVESYPALKATESFRDLSTQLEGTENRINAARIDYIEAVNDYNTQIRRLPGNLLAGMFGFEAHAQLEVPAGATERPAVEFDFGKK